MRESARERRDWSLIFLLLMLGILLMLVAGQRAVRLLPRWTVRSDMNSNLNPIFPYQSVSGGGVIQPLSAGILTPEPWNNTYLTPGAGNIMSGTVVPFVVFNPNSPPAVTVTPVPNTSSSKAAQIPNTGSTSSSTTSPTYTTTNKPTLTTITKVKLTKAVKFNKAGKPIKKNKTGKSGGKGNSTKNNKGKQSGGSPPPNSHGHHHP